MPQPDTDIAAAPVWALTMIAAAPRRDCAARADMLATSLRQQGYTVADPVALHQEQAYDLMIADGEADALRAIAAASLDGEQVDVIVQEAVGRRKRFLLADMESTIIRQEMLEEMAETIGARAHVAEVTRRAMNGEIDFATALRERVALFAGQPVRLLEDMLARITFMPGAATLVATMKHFGSTCWLASGGFRCFTQPVAAKLGFDLESANDLLIEDGHLTGGVAEPILDRNAKLAVLRRGLDRLGLDASSSLTVGDGANDLPMLNASTVGGGLGVAFHAKPAVLAQSRHHIVHADLTALLYAQGYKLVDFRT